MKSGYDEGHSMKNVFSLCLQLTKVGLYLACLIKMSINVWVLCECNLSNLLKCEHSSKSKVHT